MSEIFFGEIFFGEDFLARFFSKKKSRQKRLASFITHDL